MPVVLSSERPLFSSGYRKNKKNVKFVSNANNSEVRKECPWAVITVPHVEDGVEGHMVFRTVSDYTNWVKENKLN